MSKDLFEETFQHMCDVALRLWVQDGCLQTVAAVLSTEDGEAGKLFALDTSSRDSKQASYELIGKEYEGQDVLFYVQVAEAWASEAKSQDDMEGYPAPSDDPNRTSIVLVFGRHKDGRVLYRMWRDKKGILEEEKKEEIPKVTSVLDQILFNMPAMPFVIGKDGKLHKETG